MAPAPDWDRMALVGRVARAHGIRGQVIVNPETDFPEERFGEGAELFTRRAGGQVETLSIVSVRFHRGRPIVGFEGIADMNAASRLAGAELRVPIERLATLPAGTFYRHDLLGCAVETRRGARVGVVTDIEGTIDRSRLVVETPDGEVLVPMAAEICTTIDPARKQIVIDPPEGLLDLNRGRG